MYVDFTKYSINHENKQNLKQLENLYSKTWNLNKNKIISEQKASIQTLTIFKEHKKLTADL